MASFIEQQQIAARYGRALFDALEKDVARKNAQGELSSLVSLLDTSPEFYQLCHSPLINKAKKMNGVRLVAEASGLSVPVTQTLISMTEHGRLSYISQLHNAFVRILREHAGVRDVQVITARELSAKQLQRIEKDIASALGSKAAVTTSINPELIGGIKVRIGSKELDASVKGKLAKAASHLYETIQQV